MSENNIEIEIEELKKSLKSALHEAAVPLKEIDFTRENYNKLFPYSKVNSPIETVKLGANQFEKLEKKERQKILQAVHDTLATPDVIINEEKEDVFGEKENSHLYAKSYIIDDKIHGIQSVVVSIDGENVSISTHEHDINNIVNKIKKPDQLLYAAAEVRLLVERATGKQLVTVNQNRNSEYVASPSQNISQNQTLSTLTAKTEAGAKRKIYLSGKITGDEGFAEKFKVKEEELTARGDFVFNPALHPDMFTHGQFMQIDFLALSFCDSIYLMNNWRESKGAKMEFEQARILGLPCEFEEKELCLLRHYENGKEEIPTYYSNKKEEFVGLEYITANDFFDNKREAEEKVWSALDWDNGNVQVVSVEEVFGKQKNISLEKTVKDEKDISKVQNAIQAALEENATPIGKITELLDGTAAAMILSNGKQPPPSNNCISQEKLKDNNESSIPKLGSKLSLDLERLFREEKSHGNRSLPLIDGDYLQLSNSIIRYSKRNGVDYYDFMSGDDGVVCEDGEICEIVSYSNGEYILRQEDLGIPFVLSEEEFKYASQKMNIEQRFSPESVIAFYLKDIQTAISGNNYSDSYVLNLSKNILFNRGATLHLKSAKNDYTKTEIKEIKNGLKMLKANNPKKLVDVLKNTDPEFAKEITKDYEKKIKKNQQNREVGR